MDLTLCVMFFIVIFICFLYIIMSTYNIISLSCINNGNEYTTCFCERKKTLSFCSSSFSRPSYIINWDAWPVRPCMHICIKALADALINIASYALDAMNLFVYYDFGAPHTFTQKLHLDSFKLHIDFLKRYFVSIILQHIIYVGHWELTIICCGNKNSYYTAMNFYKIPDASTFIVDNIKYFSTLNKRYQVTLNIILHKNHIILLTIIILAVMPTILSTVSAMASEYVLIIFLQHPIIGPIEVFISSATVAQDMKPTLDIADKKTNIPKSLTTIYGLCPSDQLFQICNESFEGADGSVQCCDGESDAHLCFELQENKDDDVGVAPMQPFSCLPARIALTMSSKTCITSSECPTDTYCLAPSLHNVSRLLQITRRGGGSNLEVKDDVLYLGPPGTLHHTLQLSNYVPKYSFVPLSWPNNLETYCDYMVKFSGALAVLNMVPVFYLDGYWIFGALIDLLFVGRLELITRRSLQMLISMCGTTLLALNLILGIRSIL
ncbi:unnamed protein product, partial [Meganyctiphanes norvegica]